MTETPHDASAGPPAPARLDSATRERAVEVLTHGFAEDRLTEAELEERLDGVYRATTRAEVDALLAGLSAPVGSRSPVAPASRPPTTCRLGGPFARCSRVASRA